MANKDARTSTKDNVLVRALARWEWEGGRIELGHLPEEKNPVLQSPVNSSELVVETITSDVHSRKV